MNLFIVWKKKNVQIGKQQQEQINMIPLYSHSKMKRKESNRMMFSSLLCHKFTNKFFKKRNLSILDLLEYFIFRCETTEEKISLSLIGQLLMDTFCH